MEQSAFRLFGFFLRNWSVIFYGIFIPNAFFENKADALLVVGDAREHACSTPKCVVLVDCDTEKAKEQIYSAFQTKRSKQNHFANCASFSLSRKILDELTSKGALYIDGKFQKSDEDGGAFCFQCGSNGLFSYSSMSGGTAKSMRPCIIYIAPRLLIECVD